MVNDKLKVNLKHPNISHDDEYWKSPLAMPLAQGTKPASVKKSKVGVQKTRKPDKRALDHQLTNGDQYTTPSKKATNDTELRIFPSQS